jgi:hypothetical protein
MHTTLPIHLRPRREKLFGYRRTIPLDRNAKIRIRSMPVVRVRRLHCLPISLCKAKTFTEKFWCGLALPAYI